MVPSRLVVAAVLMAWTAPALAANAIAGVVNDRNGEPVPRAQVRLVPEDEDRGTFLMVTDSEGRFLVDYLREEDGARSKLAKKTNYSLEIFKAGFHVETRDFFYKKGEVRLDTIVLVEDTIRVEESNVDLAGGLERIDTQSGGGSYEGQ